GLRCPIGSHIRRVNPRDSLPFTREKSLELTRRHRLVRRARKYKESVEDEDGTTDEDGLCFIALNADLRRQFEFIQETWINSPTFGGLDNDKDPNCGDNDGSGEFTIQGDPAALRIYGIDRFVRVRGGGYFFLPGIAALKYLADY